MKTVTGKITGSAPVSISKASSIISKYISSADTRASQAINAYLRRTNTAFEELVRLHSKSNSREHKRHHPTQNSEANLQLTHTSERTKKKKREAVESIVENNLVGDKMGIVKEEDQKRKKRRMK